MIPESLIREAQKQCKAALARVNYSYDWKHPEIGKYSVINHPLIPPKTAYQINLEAVGLGIGWRTFRGH
jgi:hypothetical protein